MYKTTDHEIQIKKQIYTKATDHEIQIKKHICTETKKVISPIAVPSNLCK